jgi:long-subunit fatty acid transport protein
LLATTSIATAGGIDRTAPSTGILFEEGTYAEIGFTSVSPDVSGEVDIAGIASGDIAPQYFTTTLRYRQDITDTLSFAFIYDQPYGADVDYPSGTGYPFAGSTAEIRSDQLTAILRYELANNISVYGGIRALQATGDAFVSTPAFTYFLESESDFEAGYLVGAAYERPDIALRVALTYYSGIDLDFSGRQAVAGPGTSEAAINAAAADGSASFTVELPQQLLLEAQTGIAEGTLLFGSIRWTDYEGFTIVPGGFPTPSGQLVDFDEDVFTYNIGIGRRITDDLSLSATVTYEEEQDTIAGNLGPTDGILNFGIGGEYTFGQISLAAGVTYGIIGDAETELGGGATSSFTDNDVFGFGMRVGYQF